MREVFLFPSQNGLPAHRMQLFYDKNKNDLPFSINEQLDSAKKMKLYKVEFDYDTFYDERQKIQWPAFKGTTEIKRVVVENVDEPNLYLKRYLQITTPQSSLSTQ